MVFHPPFQRTLSDPVCPSLVHPSLYGCFKASSQRDFGRALHFQDSYFQRRRVAVQRVHCLQCGKPSGTGTKGGFLLCSCLVHRWTECIVVIALLFIVVSSCEAASVSHCFCCVHIKEPHTIQLSIWLCHWLIKCIFNNCSFHMHAAVTTWTLKHGLTAFSLSCQAFPRSCQPCCECPLWVGGSHMCWI